MLLNQASGATGASRNNPELSALTVSDAMGRAKRALEDVTVSIVGEVSEVNSKSGYKAVYFTIKDDNCALPCMIWNNRYAQSNVKLTLGMRVVVTGRFSVYLAKGRMSFDAFNIIDVGAGDIRMKIERLANQLRAEGLTSDSVKRPLPRLPERIGIVTSPRGAVVHDVLRTLRRRFPAAHAYVAGVPVEGANAVPGLIQGLRACEAAGCQVILLVRGGGSFEDLLPFSDERLARAIRACSVPVVTGIGHETDNTIADLVSDKRSSTPTAAAEDVVPDANWFNALFADRASRLSHGMQGAIQRASADVLKYEQRNVLRDPRTILERDAMTLDLLNERLQKALPSSISKSQATVDSLEQRLSTVGARVLDPYKNEFALRASRLDDLSPLNILSRGYSVARDEDGVIVKSVDQVSQGSRITVSVSDGSIDCSVSQTSKTR